MGDKIINGAEAQILTERVMRELGDHLNKVIDAAFGKKGFALIIFDFNQPGVSNYVSNAKREDMVAALRETANRLEKNQDIPRAHPTVQ